MRRMISGNLVSFVIVFLTSVVTIKLPSLLLHVVNVTSRSSGTSLELCEYEDVWAFVLS